MKKVALAFVLLWFALASAFGQDDSKQIEIKPYVRWDRYPEFTYRSGPALSHTNYVNIRGTSYGINLAYKHPLSGWLFLKPGISYHRYAFTHIEKYNTQFGKNNVRPISFPSPLFIPFFTDRYWYHTVSVNIGIETQFRLTKGLHLITGADLANYFTTAQGYHITYDNANNPITNPHRLKKRRFFGLSALFNAGLQQQMGRFRLGPSLLVPVYDRWRQDEVFGEDPALSKSKWLKGIGLGISCNYPLTKKMK